MAIGKWIPFFGMNHQSAIVTLKERKSQFEHMAITDGTKAASVEKQMINLLAPLKAMIKTITYYNGKEFELHQTIAKINKCGLLFAQPYSPWQRRLNEYQNKLIK